MKVIECLAPGEFVSQEKDRPVLTPNHAIIKIERIGVCGTDLHAYEGTQPYFTYPRILGHEIAGTLVEFDNAPGFRKGEAVTFIPYFYCGNCIACRSGKTNCCAAIHVFGVHIDGGMAEYVSVPSYSLLHGDGLSFDQLALVEPMAIGRHGIRRAKIKPHEFVLIMGAGPIGLGAMEYARLAGANVIAMDINRNRLQFCMDRLKAGHVIHAADDDVVEQLRTITGGDMPTVVIDATGSQKAINNGFQYMAHGARFVLIGLQKGDIHFSHPEFHKREATLMSSRNATRDDFEDVIRTIKNKNVDPIVYITHRIRLGEVRDHFEAWLKSRKEVIKAMIDI